MSLPLSPFICMRLLESGECFRRARAQSSELSSSSSDSKKQQQKTVTWLQNSRVNGSAKPNQLWLRGNDRTQRCGGCLRMTFAGGNIILTPHDAHVKLSEGSSSSVELRNRRTTHTALGQDEHLPLDPVTKAAQASIT